MDDFEKFLSFDGYRDIDEIKPHFYEVAHRLFYGHVLQAKNGEKFYITDLELYLYNNDSFQDPFMTARHHTQLTSGRFYIHRSKKNHKKFKQPNFIGLDITCGSPFECFGGLLIRGIKNIETDEEINGCAKVLNYLISGKEDTKLISKKWSQDELNSLSELGDSSIFNCQVFQLIHNDYQLGQPYLYIGIREHGQKIESSTEEKYSSCPIKVVSSLSTKSSKDKFQKFELPQALKK